MHHLGDQPDSAGILRGFWLLVKYRSVFERNKPMMTTAFFKAD